ncbi:MAG: hypothetical protein JW846_04520 [Dehalococcoidia bacterium]|nr:hypothetical protein [Dehalococcoidia bacterium]
MYRDRLLRALMEQGLVVFSIAEARHVAEQEAIPASSVAPLLANLTRSEWVSRLRRGLYVMSGPVPGTTPVHSFTIATHLVVPSAISHWSALHYHGLTEQIPRVVTAFTPKSVVTPGMRRPAAAERRRKHAWTIQGVRYEYVTVKPEHYFGVEPVWVDEHSQVGITDKERTILETFISPRTFGGLGQAMGILQEHLGSLQISKLIDYALKCGTVAAAKRLGWTLEHAGIDERYLTPLLELSSSGYHLLDPVHPRKGPRERRWMIQNNMHAHNTR